MKVRAYSQSFAAEACARWLTAAAGGRKPALVAEIVSLVAGYETLSAPLLLQGERGDPFRNAVAFPVSHEGRREFWDRRRGAAARMRPDTCLLLVQAGDGTVHADWLKDPDLTPARAADDIRLRLSKRRPGTRERGTFGLPEQWRSPPLMAHNIAVGVRGNSAPDPMSGLRPLLEELLHGEPVRASFDGTVSLDQEDGVLIGMRLKARKGGYSLSVTSDATGDLRKRREVRAGQVIGRLGDDPSPARHAKSLAGLVTSALVRWNDGRNAKAAADFLGLLDHRVYDAMREFEEDGIPLYNWMSASSDDKLMAVRRQAFETYPVLVESLTRHRPGTLACVDEEANFVDRVSAELGTTRRAVRALRGVTWSDLKDEFHDPSQLVLEILPSLRQLPDGHLPSAGGNVPAGQQWKSLLLVAVGAKRARVYAEKSMSDSSGLRRSRAPVSFETVMPDLAAEDPFWLRKAGLGQSRAIHYGSWHVDDVRREAAVALVYPLLRDMDHDGSIFDLGYDRRMALMELPGPDGTSAIQRVLMRNHGELDLSRIAHEFGERGHRIINRVTEESAPTSWPAWSGARDYRTREGTFRIVPLTTSEELAAEGEALEHCVATYVRAASAGNCHIYSVRHENGTILSTIELRWGEKEGFWISQHRGIGDRRPPKAASEASEEWLSDIREGRLAVTPFEIEQTLAVRWKREIGYDPADIQARDAALRAWGFVLPPEERDMSHAEWAERHRLPELLEGLVAEMTAESERRPAVA